MCILGAIALIITVLLLFRKKQKLKAIKPEASNYEEKCFWPFTIDNINE